MKKNIFCTLENLNNESAVEQFFIIRLLGKLGFKDDFINTKQHLDEYKIGKGRNKKGYAPDYILYLDKAKNKPIVIIDAKSPLKQAEEGISDAQLYTSILRRKISSPKPDQYCIGTNGKMLLIKHFESDQLELKMDFEDFNENNQKYKKLINQFSYNILKNKYLSNKKSTNEEFSFEKPDLKILDSLFKNCHNLIWKREKMPPQDAFYEFSKLFFLKLHHDRKINRQFKKGNKHTKDIFVFSTHWIDRERSVEPNPINAILFNNLQKELKNEMHDKKRKRIFDQNEELMLKPSTIEEVVGLLQHYNFHDIDEDLNGRMFETFLSSTMTGKDLGQFFTPREVTKFMTKLADIKINKNRQDTILDACCGTGGFLIEAMANLLYQIKENISYSSEDKKELYRKAINECIWGADASKKMPRIARMNMYLHGDSGSRIYLLNDALDKLFEIEEGLSEETKRETEEFKELIINKRKKFDIVLTNPPFAMKYKIKDKDGKKILSQYEITKQEGTNKIISSVNSNVLFIERYHDLLEKGGKLITVIDDSVLNSTLDKKYRKYIRKNFIIKAVISLPFNTFKNAGTSTKTSILYLQKKKSENEQQPSIFMAICNNIGHDDFGRKTPQRNNLPEILKYYKKYEEEGTITPKIINNQKDTEVLTCPMQFFSAQPNELKDRIDAFYYSPVLKNLQNSILKNNKNYLFKDFNIVKTISNKELKSQINNLFKYVEVGNIDKKGSLLAFQENKLELLPTRARKKVKEGDVIIAKNISSLGNVMIIPNILDDQLVSTGFIVIRPKCKEERNILWSICRSKIITTQMYYLSATAVQPEVSENTFKNDLLIPFPKDKKNQKQISSKVDSLLTYLYNLDIKIKDIDSLLMELKNN